MVFQDRLSHIIQIIGATKIDFSKQVDLSKAQLFNYLSGKQEPKAKFFRIIKEQYPWINLEWLITGEGIPDLREMTFEAGRGNFDMELLQTVTGGVEGEKGDDKCCPCKAPQDSGIADTENNLNIPTLEKPEPTCYNWIPMVEARLTSGGGEFEVNQKNKNFYAFRKPFIHKIASSPGKLVLMQVTGDSMEPDIQDGGTVLVDLGKRRPKSGAFFAMGFDDAIVVKELDLLPGGMCRIISRNRSLYEPYTVRLSDIRIIGQIIWGDRMFPQ